MTLFSVLVDVYHKEQLLTKEEAEELASGRRSWDLWWEGIAVTKDASSSARIADIMYKHGCIDIAQLFGGMSLRVLCDTMTCVIVGIPRPVCPFHVHMK